MPTFEIVWFFWWLIGFVPACLLEMKLLKLSALPERHDGVFELHVMDKNGYFKVQETFGDPKKILVSI
jgi:hypothetical protein